MTALVVLPLASAIECQVGAGWLVVKALLVELRDEEAHGTLMRILTRLDQDSEVFSSGYEEVWKSCLREIRPKRPPNGGARSWSQPAHGTVDR